jgi:peptidoglycan/LPS O-acetylase OafA/YrhL
VCLLTRRRWVLLPMLVLLALSLPFTRALLDGNEIWQEKAYLPGMAAIATGVIGALLAARWPTLSTGQVRALYAFGVIGLLASMLGGRWLWPLLHDGVMLLLTVSAMSLLLACQARPPRPWRGFGWLRSWGRLSYEIYLSHMFVVFTLVWLYRASGGDVKLGFLWYLPALLLCWGLGALVAHGLSQPCERWLRRRLSRPSAVEPTAICPAG